MDLEDPKLEKELDEALCQHGTTSRDQDKKPIDPALPAALGSDACGSDTSSKRRCGKPAIAWCWMLAGSRPTRLYARNLKNAGKKHPQATLPADPSCHQKPSTSTPGSRAGPSSVNQTDNDWNDVQLSLVSGRPLSFIQDLYHSLYIRRPVIEPDLGANLSPQTYDGGIAKEESEKADKAAEAAKGGGGGGGAGAGLFSDGKVGTGKDSGGLFQGPMDPTSSVVSAASAGQIGELFQYTIGSVSARCRQKSAMIPIVTDDVEAERLSIYNSMLAHSSAAGRSGEEHDEEVRSSCRKSPSRCSIAAATPATRESGDVPARPAAFHQSYGIDQQVLVDAAEVKQVQRNSNRQTGQSGL